MLDMNDVVKLLGWNKQTVLTAILHGVQLPMSKSNCKLNAQNLAGEWRFEETDLNLFIANFEAEEPGRHPPVDIRRTLAVESNHRCAICRHAYPLQYHHIIEWNEIKHFDPQHMLAACGSCHDLMSNGTIDRKAQYLYKNRLFESAGQEVLWGCSTGSLPWDELRAVIDALHSTLSQQTATTESQFDYDHVAIETVKNRLNNLPVEHFKLMVEHDEPHFHSINEFLGSPANEEVRTSYFEMVDDIRRRLSQYRNGASPRFDEILADLRDAVLNRFPTEMKGKRRTLNCLLSFMYFNCDIGRKQ